MPKKLDKATRAAVTRYFSVRYSHWTAEEVRDRKRLVVSELAQRTDWERAEYREKVNQFFEINAGVLEQARKDHAAIVDAEKNAKTTELIFLPTEEVLRMTRQAGGNVNLVEDVLSGDDNK